MVVQVPLSEVRAKLSQLVTSPEVVAITQRGTVVAHLVPIGLERKPAPAAQSEVPLVDAYHRSLPVTQRLDQRKIDQILNDAFPQRARTYTR